MGLDCAGCTGVRCEDRAGRYHDADYPTCPVRFVADDQRLQLALRLVRAQQFAPIAGWSDDYVAWVTSYAPTVRRAVIERAQHDTPDPGAT